MSNKYTTLLFDADNTLLDFSMAEKSSVKNTFLKLGLPSKEENIALYSKINDECWKALERGEMTNTQVYTERFKRYLREIGEDFDAESLNKTYFSFLSQCAYKVNGCDEILDYLYGKYMLYIVTNGAAFNQHSRIKKSGIESKVEGLFISEEIGYKKPQKEFFEAVISDIPEKDRSKILIIGDSLSSDIKGGINAGIDTCFVNFENVEQYLPSTYTVNSLLQLKNFL